MGVPHPEVSRRLKVSGRCIRWAFRKFDKFYTVATKSGTGHSRKVAAREKRVIRLQQLRVDTDILIQS